MTLSPGTSFGPYEVLGPLGAGGMGEVYRARDSQLRRDVALKVLPEAFAGDPERLARFTREAQLLASLNHPNIGAIHGLEEGDGRRALILELVEGPTLAERIAGGAIPVDEALRIGLQIARGLEAAHEKGVIHRDLKPSNIKLTPGETVKVLDFGLAKALSSETGAPELSSSPTISGPITGGGVVLGTAPYMSPEQTRGKPLDRRADVWSFGCVLYEMLARRRAFPGETMSDTAVAILSHEPDWRALPARTPPRVRSLLRRCLQRETSRRLRDMGDIGLELEEALAEMSGPAEADRRSSGSRRRPAWAGVIAVGLLGVLAAWWARGRIESARPIENIRLDRLTDFVGLEVGPAFSADGRSVAFSADVTGPWQVWVQLLAGGAPLRVTSGPSDHLYPRWSRDSANIVYYTPSGVPGEPGTLWEIGALGGVPRRIGDGLSGADISPDDKRLAFFRFGKGRIELTITDRSGGSSRSVAELPPHLNYSTPRWSPDGRYLAYESGSFFDSDVYVVPAEGGSPRNLTRAFTTTRGFAWLPDGSGILCSSARNSTILYLQSFQLYAFGLSEADPRPRQLTFGEASYLFPDVGASGQVATSRLALRSDIWKIPVDRTPTENVRRATPVTRQTGQVYTPSIGPGGREVAFLSDLGGHGNVWIGDMTSGQVRQVTRERDPQVPVGVTVWSPDGRNICYITRTPGAWNVNLWLVNADGSNPRRVAEQSGWAAWSPDGRWLYHTLRDLGGNWLLQKYNVDDGSVVNIRKDGAHAPALSPDGHTLYFMKALQSLNGVADLEVRWASPETAESKLLTRISGSRLPGWQFFQPAISPDGRWLTALLNDGPSTNIWAVSTADGALRQLTDFAPRRTFIARRVEWSPDGRFVFAAVAEGDADVVLLDRLPLLR